MRAKGGKGRMHPMHLLRKSHVPPQPEIPVLPQRQNMRSMRENGTYESDVLGCDGGGKGEGRDEGEGKSGKRWKRRQEQRRPPSPSQSPSPQQYSGPENVPRVFDMVRRPTQKDVPDVGAQNIFHKSKKTDPPPATKTALSKNTQKALNDTEPEQPNRTTNIGQDRREEVDKGLGGGCEEG